MIDKRFIEYRDLVNEEKPETLERFWNYLNGHQKHMILMYVYRLKVEEDFTGFIEVYRFQQWKLTLDHVPNFILKMNPDKLKKEALCFG